MTSKEVYEWLCNNKHHIVLERENAEKFIEYLDDNNIYYTVRASAGFVDIDYYADQDDVNKAKMYISERRSK